MHTLEDKDRIKTSVSLTAFSDTYLDLRAHWILFYCYVYLWNAGLSHGTLTTSNITCLLESPCTGEESEI